MNQKRTGRASSSERIIRDIKRKTCKQFEYALGCFVVEIAGRFIDE